MPSPDPTFAQKVEEVFKVEDAGWDYNVRLLSGPNMAGYLDCTCKEFKIRLPGDAQWCRHCEEVIQDRREIQSNIMPLHFKLVVQRKPGAVIIVNLEQASDFEQPEAYSSEVQAIVIHQPQDSEAFDFGRDPKFEDTYHVGYLNRGEGVLVLRDLVLDWLTGFAYDKIDCEHPYHVTGARTFTFESLADELGGKPLAELVSLLMTKKCLSCRLDNDVPDLSEGQRPNEKKRYKG